MRRAIALLFSLVILISATASTVVARNVRPLDASNCNKDLVTFYEDGYYRGPEWTVKMCLNPGWLGETWANAPAWFNDMASGLCLKVGIHDGWYLTVNVYSDANRHGFLKWYSSPADGAGYRCWDFPNWMNDKMSSAGLVWTR